MTENPRQWWLKQDRILFFPPLNPENRQSDFCLVFFFFLCMTFILMFTSQPKMAASALAIMPFFQPAAEERGAGKGHTLFRQAFFPEIANHFVYISSAVT